MRVFAGDRDLNPKPKPGTRSACLAETVTSFTDPVVRAKMSSLGGPEMGFRQRLIRVD